MLNRNFFLGALLALSVSFLVAFSNAKTESNAVYEYVTLVKINNAELVISEQGKEIQSVKINSKSYNDYRALYDEVNKYEAQGWELFSNNHANLNVYMLRRKKQ